MKITGKIDGNTLTKTAEAILTLPDEGTFTHRRFIVQWEWDDTDICSYAELKALATAFLEDKHATYNEN